MNLVCLSIFGTTFSPRKMIHHWSGWLISKMTHPKNNSDRIFLLRKVNFSDSLSSFWWFIESQIKSFSFFQKMYSKDFVTNRRKYWSLIGQIVSRQNWIWHSIIQNSDSSVSERNKEKKKTIVYSSNIHAYVKRFETLPGSIIGHFTLQPDICSKLIDQNRSMMFAHGRVSADFCPFMPEVDSHDEPSE